MHFVHVVPNLTRITLRPTGTFAHRSGGHDFSLASTAYPTTPAP